MQHPPPPDFPLPNPDSELPLSNLPRPYSTSEIQRRPWAVIVSLLIGLLLASAAAWWQTATTQNKRIQELTDKADREKTERIRMYEDLIFYKSEANRLSSQQTASDSLIRSKTGPYVHRILQQP